MYVPDSFVCFDAIKFEIGLQIITSINYNMKLNEENIWFYQIMELLELMLTS